MSSPRPPLGSVLLHPIALASLVTLVVNDHVLKQRWPGWVTGKLSDFAGMVLAPLVLVALVDRFAPFAGRRAYVACSAIVAVAFVVVKTLPLPRPVVIVRDPTDLVALPMGIVAVLIAQRHRSHVVHMLST